MGLSRMDISHYIAVDLTRMIYIFKVLLEG